MDQINGLISAAGVSGTEEILNAFWRSTEELLAALSSQISDGAYGLAAKTAHAIKGSAANIGASRLAATVSKLENACKANDGGLASDLMAVVRSDFDATKICLLDYLRQSA